MATQWSVNRAYGQAAAQVAPAPVPAAAARVPVGLLIGDIIIQNNFHAYMWVGDTGGVLEREVVHNVENAVFNGIQRVQARFSADYTYLIFRIANNWPLATNAAKHAAAWATDTPRVAKGTPMQTLKSKYSHDRSVQAQDLIEAKATPAWSMESLLRAVKASIREEHLARKKGSTCSSFVTYCYQAAAISQRMGELEIPPHVLNLLKGDRTGCVKLKASAPDVITFFQALFQENKIPFPKGIRVDAKTTYVKLLQKDLQQPDSGFDLITDSASWNGACLVR